METRFNGKYVLGFYKSLNKHDPSSNLNTEKKIKKTIKKDLNKNEFAELINDINISILKKLKPFSKQSRINTCKIIISDKILNILIDRFKLNGKYRICKEFTEEFSIKTKRFFNFNEFSTCPFIEFKINRGRIFNYYEDNMNKVELKSKPLLFIRFLRQDKKIIN